MSNADNFKLYVQQPKAIATVSANGDVTLNWHEINRVAHDQTEPSWAYARIFCAIRDNTWKPVE